MRPQIPPEFERELEPTIKVVLTLGVDGQLEDRSIVTYTSPKAIDP